MMAGMATQGPRTCAENNKKRRVKSQKQLSYITALSESVASRDISSESSKSIIMITGTDTEAGRGYQSSYRFTLAVLYF